MAMVVMMPMVVGLVMMTVLEGMKVVLQYMLNYRLYNLQIYLFLDIFPVKERCCGCNRVRAEALQ